MSKFLNKKSAYVKGYNYLTYKELYEVTDEERLNMTKYQINPYYPKGQSKKIRQSIYDIINAIEAEDD